MAITQVGTTETATAGPADLVTSGGITINIPTGLAVNDVLLVAVSLARHKWVRNIYPTYPSARRYNVNTPTGWQFQGRATTADSFNAYYGALWVFLRQIDGTEGSTVTFPISQVVNDTADVNLVATATAVAYTNVATGQPVGTEVLTWDDVRPAGFTGGGSGGGGTFYVNRIEVTYTGTALLEFVMAFKGNGVVPTLTIDVGTTEVAQTGVALTAARNYNASNQPFEVQAQQDRIATGRRIVGPGEYPAPTFTTNGDTDTWVQLGLTDIIHSNTDPPPAPGSPGTTGSGALIPERDVIDPLITTLWDVSGGALVETEDETVALQVISCALTFNGLGVCTGGTIVYPARPGYNPLGRVVRLAVDAAGLSTPIWYSALPVDVQYDAGLWRVELVGLWALRSRGRIATSGTGGTFQVDLPTVPDVTVGDLILDEGSGVTIEENTLDELTAWDTYLAEKFDRFTDAGWGVGPDLIYAQGRPAQAGYVVIDATTQAGLLTVKAVGFVEPPYITEWGALDSVPNLVESTRTLPALTPRIVAQSRVDSGNALLEPNGASLPPYAGPSYRLTYAGIAIPPFLITDLPDGLSQYVAGAEVQIEHGEEDRAATITTVLTTVALPYAL